MRFLIAAVLVLNYGLCLAEDFPSDRLFPKSNKGAGLSSQTRLETELNAVR